MPPPAGNGSVGGARGFAWFRITILDRVEVLSTHDQILGGESGRVFGAVWPGKGSGPPTPRGGI